MPALAVYVRASGWAREGSGLMRKHSNIVFVSMVLSAALVSAAGCAAPSMTDQPGTQERADMSRSNYLVALEGAPLDLSSADSVEAARRQLDQAREAVLSDVFGDNGYAAAADGRSGVPSYGQTFVSAYGFEMRMTADEAQRLTRHEAVRTLEADTLARPTGARPDG